MLTVDTFSAAVLRAERGELADAEAMEAPWLWPKPRRWRSALRKTMLCMLLLLGAASGYLYWQSQQIVNELQATNKAPLVASVMPELDIEPARPAPGIDSAITFLAIGADKRYGESGRGRSDTMLLVRIDPDKQTASMLSLPRDLLVPIPGHGVGKINSAYAIGGPALLTKTLREYLGVRVNHFAQVDFNGFGQLVSNLGGVYLPIDARYNHVSGPGKDNWASIDVRPGYQKMGREDALSWVRFRHLDSDFYRAARQQIYVREVGRQMRAKKSSPTEMPSLMRVIAKATTSDIDSVSEMLKLANTLKNIPPDRISRVTISGHGARRSDGEVLIASEQQKQEALRAWSRPGQIIRRQGAPKRKANRRKIVRDGKARLVSDSGRGAQLAGALYGVERCAPTQLPPGYIWPQGASRRYELAGRPAAALFASEKSGVSVLWMWTKWQKPPILEQPDQEVTLQGRRYQLFFESGKLRMVAWRLGDTRVWITNTLRNELSNKRMLGLATSCRPL